MERDMDEIAQSQKTMLQRLGKLPEVASGSGDITKAYRQQERHAKGWCLRLGIPAISVNFHDLVHDCERVLLEITRFLGVADKLPAMRGCIDPALHREFKNSLRSKKTDSAESQLAKMIETAIC
jgi:hypothetical protein